MRTYEQTFINPLLAMSFKDGIDFVGDPDMTALDPKKAADGSGKWIVVIEDTNEYEEDEDTPIESSCGNDKCEVQHYPPPKTGKDKYKPERVTFEEYRTLTKKNMIPKTAKPEPGTTIIPTIAEPGQSKRGRVIIPEVDESMNDCGICINCQYGDECIGKIYAACAELAGER